MNLEIALDSHGSRTLAAALYKELRRDILTAKLLPGARLQVASLANRFQVSIAGIREALSRLVADGLVQAIDQRGFRVSPVLVEDLQDVTRTRIEIECLAIEKSISLGEPSWEAEIRDSLTVMTAIPYKDPAQPHGYNEAYIPPHDRFHAALVGACGSNWLLKFRQILHEQSERYRRLSVPLEFGRRGVEKEHRLLAKAVLSRDAKKATALLAAHYNATMQLVLKSSYPAHVGVSLATGHTRGGARLASSSRN